MRSGDPTQPLDVTEPYLDGSGAPIGGQLGRFRVDGMLGRGGMGIVLDAYDPELARAVAVKLLRPDVWGDEADVDRARLVREAQAMAKLSHPNVVTVYEVGVVDGQAFLAMERVDGETLRAWQARGRTAAEVIAMYVAVGRGLAAAHAADLVHRDFKPENVLVGRDGRGRVGDFGLVSSGLAIGSGDARDAAIDTGLTVRGSVMGTPAYMAPEQWAGAAIDARTDQFAFCVALWEAVYGERPFAGTDGPAIREAVLGGQRRLPPRGSRAPSWLLPILARGLEREPDRRWPSQTALLDELTRRSAPRRLPLLAIGGAAVVGGAVVIALLTRDRGAAADPCPSPGARLAGIWDDATQARLREHLRRLDPARADGWFATIARVATPHSAKWEAMHVASCKATRAGQQSDGLHDQRVRCLDDRLAELGRTVEVTLAVTRPTQIEPVLGGWKFVASVDDCADRAVVTAFTPPPRPLDRPEALAITDELRAIEIDRRAGDLDGLHDRGAAALARARTLGHDPLLATALLRVAQVELDRASGPEAATLLREAIQVAARAGEDLVAAAAWTRLLRVTAFELGKPDDAVALMPAAEAAVARAADRLDDRIELLLAGGDVAMMRKDHAAALVKAGQARALLEAAGAAAPDSPRRAELAEVRFKTGSFHQRAGDYEASIVELRAAIAIYNQALGDGHPDSAAAHINLTQSLARLDRKDEALAAIRAAVRIRDEHLGDSPGLAWALGAYGNLLREARDYDAALPVVERALAMANATMKDDNPQKIAILNTVAVTYAMTKRYDEARAIYDQAIAIGDRTNAVNSNRTIVMMNRADLDSKDGDCATALPIFERVRAIETEQRGPGAPAMIPVTRRIALCQLALGQADAAIATLTEALALPSLPSHKIDLMLVRHLLGEALVRSRRDPTRGRKLLADAATEALALGDVAGSQRLFAVNWLAKYYK